MMRTKRFSFFGVALCVFTAVTATFAQGWSFSDPNADFGFDVPDAKWKLTVRPNAASQRTELVYGDRRDGLLEVRSIDVQKSDTMNDVMIADEQKHRQFLQGYVNGRSEAFAGRLRGSVANFEFVSSGRNMSGRYYFLRANDTTVYVLRFTGAPESLRGLRVQTDQIARTFRIKTS